ncbi:class I SAM-dependent methyltransferase [Cellulomonas sp. ATA003]|uniref:class I SAM-dependent methyltransferase n=1 Tax=Cellulomonas sp. ATA003 TaxID=3073064 RepID=UPI0037C0D507
MGAPPGARLLDVGSAHGWLLRQATDAGLRAVGVEPDVAVARRAIDDGADVRVGFFPDALRPDDRFDVITFNDVLEHLPDPRAAVEESASRLVPGGLLVVNIPDRRGSSTVPPRCCAGWACRACPTACGSAGCRLRTCGTSTRTA